MPELNFILRRLIVSGLMLLFAIPGFGQEKTYTEDIKDGVNHINNLAPLWGEKPEIRLEFEKYFGEYNTDNDDYLFYIPVDIDADSRGNLYVLEGGGKKIKKFDADGNYIKTIGREGQGPGEFMRPNELEIDRNDNVFVVDYGNNRIEVFDCDGKYLKSLKYNRTYVDAFQLLSSGDVVMQNLATENIYRFKSQNGEKSRMPLVFVYNSEGKIISRIGEGWIYKPSENWKTGLNRIFFDAGPDDNIYTAMIWQNRLEKFRPDGSQVFRTNRPVDPDNGIEDFTVKVGKMPWDLEVDSKGRIWFLTEKYRLKFSKADRDELRKLGRDEIKRGMTYLYLKVNNIDPEEFKTDIAQLYLYDKNGILLNVFQLDRFCSKISIIGDRLYLLDKSITMRFSVYKIVENN